MKEDDKKQPESGQHNTGSEPLQPVNKEEQSPVTGQPEPPESDEGYVVKGSGLGIDE